MYKLSMYLCINLVCTLSGDAANELHYVWLIAVTKNFSQLDLSHQTFSSFLPCRGYNKKDILYSRGKNSCWQIFSCLRSKNFGWGFRPHIFGGLWSPVGGAHNCKNGTGQRANPFEELIFPLPHDCGTCLPSSNFLLLSMPLLFYCCCYYKK